MFVLIIAKGGVILANCECHGKGREDRAATGNKVNSGARLQTEAGWIQAEQKEGLSHREGCQTTITCS